jgi:uncharacterized protein YggU (UPF0235/DUF167 family)
MADLNVRVTPKSSSQKLAWANDKLKVWVHAPPANDEANKAVCRFLAEALNVPISTISIIRGNTSRDKTLSIPSLSVDEIRERLNSFVNSRKP